VQVLGPDAELSVPAAPVSARAASEEATASAAAESTRQTLEPLMQCPHQARSCKRPQQPRLQPADHCARLVR
jgi:hypothetical protein